MHPDAQPSSPTPRDLFLEALERPLPADRAAFLDAACRGDRALRAAVEELLTHHRPDQFLESPAFVIAAGITASSEQPGDRVGHYQLLEPIGEGGFGVVWKAAQEEPVRRLVALKVIKPGMDTKEVLARFEQERQALALMDHPNIARVYDGGATRSGRPFFVMELVQGVRITDYCDAQQLPIRERLTLFMQVCHAVQHAHQKGIIHRDLKPSNIMVTLRDGGPVPKVIDFGVAKATQGRLTAATVVTQLQQVLGTPLYMSPEQAGMTALDIDTRSDIYSLGVLLYELLTGCSPIDTSTAAQAGLDEIRRIVRELDPLRPSARVKALGGTELWAVAKRRRTEAAKLPGTLGGDLDWIVMKCLEKDRRRRYETASSLAHDLHRHLANEAVIARPPTSAYVLARFIQRNKLAFTAGTAVAASLVVGIMASVWQSARANHEARRAKAAESKAVAALEELRSTAPALAAQAKDLAARERFAEAIEKLDYVIKLRPDAIEHLLIKADLLECQLQFGAAATAYRAALRLEPGHQRARANETLCANLQSELDSQKKLSRKSLLQLFQAMLAENRPASELITIGRLVGEEKRLLLDYWIERLRDLPVAPARPIGKRLSMLADGTLALDLSNTTIVDLTPLEGMPLAKLNLSGCIAVTDLSALRNLPLRILHIDQTRVTNLAPLARMSSLKAVDLSDTGVSDLSPLKGLPMEQLSLRATKVVDLAPLQGMPLQSLNLRSTKVSSVQRLAGLPLVSLDCTAIPATDFRALAGASLKELNLQYTRVADLSFLRGMPLQHLILNSCALAKGYQVLQELRTLETLLLPDTVWSLPKEEIAAIAVLRRHPALRQIATESAQMQGQPLTGIESAGAFWKAWDREMSWVSALHNDGVKFTTERRKDGALAVTIEDAAFNNLSVFQGANLSALTLIGTRVTNLAPVAGLPLKQLQLRRSLVTDLSPIAGLPLQELRLKETPVTNLSFLNRAPLRDSLEILFLERLNVTDFSPIAACAALRTLSAYQSPLSDLGPLRGLHLQNLYIAGTRVRDLSPLTGMPLKELFFDLTPVSDLTPLLGISSLKHLIVSEKAGNVEALKKLPSLQRLSYHFDPKLPGPSMSTTEFWQAFGAGR